MRSELAFIRCPQYNPELIQLVRTATTDSGETDTAKWMTGAEKERK